MPTGWRFFDSASVMEIARESHTRTRLSSEIADQISDLIDRAAITLLDWIAVQAAPNAPRIRIEMGNTQRRCIALWEAIRGERWGLMGDFVPFAAAVFDNEQPGAESAQFRLARAMGAGDALAGLRQLNALGQLLAEIERAADVAIDSLLPPGARGESRHTGGVPNRVSGEPFAHAVLSGFHMLAGLPISEAKVPKASTASRQSPRPGVKMVTAAYAILRRNVASNSTSAIYADVDALNPGTAVVEKWVRSFRSKIHA